jgi:alkane 1-monooxygenase
MAIDNMSRDSECTKTSVRWSDGKRYFWLLGLLVPALPFIGWALVAATGLGVFWYAGPLFLFVVVPLVDLVVGLDPNNPPEDVVAQLDNDRYYRWVVYLYLPIQYASMVWGAWMLSRDTLSVSAKIGIALSLGVVAGVAINTAHELGHKKEEHERWYARVALAQSWYGHFFIEHNRGHHVRVSTPEDPASSRMGETMWEFLPRTVFGSLRSAWHLESDRLARCERRTWTLHNDVLNAWAMSAVLWGGLVLVFGPGILPYLVLQAVAGIWLLEMVNYLEHYGMLRQKTRTGRYERVDPSHSWNSNNIGTNVLLYHLQRHSDHHANPTRRYQALRDFDSAPVLPTGYAGMMLLSWVPPLWRRIMDPRVVAHYDGDLSRANLHPRAAERLLARYGNVSEAA